MASKGAERAADRIIARFLLDTQVDCKTLAAAIDRETHAPELAEALRKIVEECPKPNMPYGIKVVEIAQAALSKLED